MIFLKKFLEAEHLSSKTFLFFSLFLTSIVTVAQPVIPTITLNPSNGDICSGANVSFSVIATGPNLNYQWKVSTDGGGTYSSLSNTDIYNNVTTATLNLNGATSSVNGYLYNCVVSNTDGTATSIPAKLTVNTAPTITVNPSNIIPCSGNTGKSGDLDH